MENQKVLVMTARGKTGFATVQACIDLGLPVRAMVRRIDARAEELKRMGAELFVGDVQDVRDLRKAMQGVERAYYCAPFIPWTVYTATNFYIAAEEMGLKHVVAMTQWLSTESHRSTFTREQWMSDQLFRRSPNVRYTFLSPGWFADNYFMLLEPMAQLGILPMPLGDGLNAPPSNEDMGRVVAHILHSPEGHEGKVYRPTGPELLAPQEIVDIVGRVLGRKVRYMPVSKRMLLKAFNDPMYPTFQVSQLQYYVEDYRMNAFGIGGPTNVVKAITGVEPEDFETITRRYVAERPEAKKSAANKLRAIVNFMKIPLRPPVNVEKYERLANHPELKNLGPALDDEHWLKRRDVRNALGVNEVSVKA